MTNKNTAIPQICPPGLHAPAARFRGWGLIGSTLFLLIAGCGGGGGSGDTGGSAGAGGGGSSSSSQSSSATAPTISTQPQDQTVNAGGSATFSVTAAGTAPLTYQWSSGGSAISGATSASYTIASVTAQQSGTKYSVTVTNSAGSVTSSNAVLTVVSSPVIGTQPQSTTVAPGASVSFSVTATANGPLTYQWQRDGKDISGATGSSYSLPSVSIDDDGASFTVTVTDSAGNVTSSASNLRVTGLKLLAGALGGMGYADESDGKPLTARFTLPVAATIDPSSGNLFVVDGNVIRQITPAGDVTTLAGSPDLPPGYVSGAGNVATFAYPHELALDPATGTLYVADTGNLVVRKVSVSTGAVSLFAGTPAIRPYVGDPACVPSTSVVCFGLPTAIAVDGSGNVAVEDALNQTNIYQFDPQGSFGTLAADTGQALYPSAMAFNQAGTELAIADDSYVGYLSYPPAGVPTVQSIAGAPGSFAGGDSDSAQGDITGVNARFGCPLGGEAWIADQLQLDFFAFTYGATGIALNPGGTLAYVADTCNDTIRAVAVPSGVTSTLAGVAGSSGTADGSGQSARFDAPTSVTTDAVGNVYVADALNGTIRKVTPSGTVSTYAGEASTRGSSDSTDGTGLTARFNQPRGVAVDSAGNIFVVDSLNQTIRKITPAGDVTLYAGTPGKPGYQDGDAQSGTLFNYPQGLAIDKAGNLYVADTSNQVIRKITPSQVVSTYAGVPPVVSNGAVIPAPGFQDGAPGAAKFDAPIGVAVDASGDVFVADYANCAIREIVAPTSNAQAAVVTVAGKYAPGNPTCASPTSPQADGTGTMGANPATLGSPIGIALDQSGNVYYSSVSNENQGGGLVRGGATISRLSAPGTTNSTVTTIAGSPTSQGAHDGVNLAALLLEPIGMAVDAAGNIYVADRDNHAIREITLSGNQATVKTVVGALEDPTASGFNAREPIGIAVGALPGQLNAPWGIAVVSPGSAAGAGVTLAVTDQEENSVILVNVN